MIRNDGEKAESSFLFTLHESESDQIGEFFPKHKSKALTWSRQTSSGDSGLTYMINLPEAIPPKEQYEVTLLFDLVRCIKPVPDTIGEKGDQFLKFGSNRFWHSLYKTEKAKTVVSLDSKARDISISSSTPQTQTKGKEITLGPYKDVKPSSYEKYFVRWQSNRGLLVAESLEKQLFVSHWGSIQIKEEYKLENRGAKHVGRWSRVDYTRDPRHSSSAVADAWAMLPRDATDVDYRDLIGNITTSRLRKPTKHGRPIRLVFRFPLLGGWKNHFWYSYNVRLNNYVNSKGNSHIMKVPFASSFDEDILCETLKVAVFLPEGVSRVQVVGSDHGFTMKKEHVRTTLNYFGRKAVFLERQNIHSKSPHGTSLYLSYEYSPVHMLKSPLIVVASIFAFFLAIILYSRLDFRLVKASEQDEEETQKQKLIINLDGYHEEVRFLHERSRRFSILADGKAKDIDWSNLESSIRRADENVSSVLSQLQKCEVISNSQRERLVQRYAALTDADVQIHRKATLASEGKINKNEFIREIDTQVLPYVSEITADLDDFVASLVESL